MKYIFFHIIICIALCSCSSEKKENIIIAPDDWIESKSTNKKNTLEWWKAFDDPVLENLILIATQENFDIKIALEKISAARIAENETFAGLLPETSLSFSKGRQKSSSNTTNRFNTKAANLYKTEFDASWEINFFSAGDALDAAKAFLKNQDALFKSVLLIQQAEVAKTYFDYKNAVILSHIDQEQIEAQTHIVTLNKNLVHAGKISALDALRDEETLDQLKAQKQNDDDLISQAKYSLELLCGKKPGELDNLLKDVSLTLKDFKNIFIKTPLNIIEQRPDILSAKYILEQNYALKNIARFSLLPSFNLASFFGFQSTTSSKLFNKDSQAWGFSPTALLSLIDFGRYRAKLDAADSDVKQARLTLEKTILEALHDVESNLSSYTKKQWQREDAKAAFEKSYLEFEMSQKRFHAGAIPWQTALAHQQNMLQKKKDYTSQHTAASKSAIALAKSLGG